MKLGVEGLLERQQQKEAHRARKGKGLRKTFEEAYHPKKNVPVIESNYPTPESVTSEVILGICADFRVSEKDALACFEELKRDCKAKGKGYSDYKAGLEIFVGNAIKWGNIEVKKSNVQIMLEEGISVKINNKWVTSFDEYIKEYKIWEAKHENN